MPVSIALDKGSNEATVTVSFDASAIVSEKDTAKERNMAILEASAAEIQKSLIATAFESEAAIDADVAEKLAKEQARATELKAALPVTDVESKVAVPK